MLILYRWLLLCLCNKKVSLHIRFLGKLKFTLLPCCNILFGACVSHQIKDMCTDIYWILFLVLFQYFFLLMHVCILFLLFFFSLSIFVSVKFILVNKVFVNCWCFFFGDILSFIVSVCSVTVLVHVLVFCPSQNKSIFFLLKQFFCSLLHLSPSMK